VVGIGGERLSAAALLVILAVVLAALSFLESVRRS